MKINKGLPLYVTIFFSFSILFITISVVAFSIYFDYRSKIDIEKHTKELDELAKQSNENYKKLIDEQINSPSRKIKKSENGSNAVGEKTINIVFVYPTNVEIGNFSALVEKLSASKNCQDPKNIKYVECFFESEYEKYSDGISNFSIKINTYGPYPIYDLPYAGDIFNVWEKDLFATAKIADAFENLSKTNNIPLKDDDIVMYIYYDPEKSHYEAKPYSYYDYQKFRSFALEDSSRAFVNMYKTEATEKNLIETVETIAHEALHLMGSNDKYIEDEVGCSEIGKGYTTKNKIDTSKVDIMCMIIKDKEGKYSMASFSSNTLMINYYTAKEIGWVEE